MVDKVSVNPLSVRGAGDIVSPKTASDFDVYNSTIVSSSEDVDGAVMTVYTVSYVSGTYFTVSSESIVPVGEASFTVSAVLKKNSDDSAVSGASVSCTVNGDSVLTGTTDSNGSVSFTIPTMEDVSKYTVKLVYSGTQSVGGAFKVTGLLCIDLSTLTLGLTVDKIVMQVGDELDLRALLTATDGEGATVGVPSQDINFYVIDDFVVKELSLSVDNGIISAYDSESAVLTATYTKNDEGVSGKTVTFKKGNTVLGSATTNDNGVATYIYNAEGSGDVTITAECMNLQETYVLEDCIIYDSLTSNSGKWTIPSDVTSVYDNTGWKITASSYNQIKLTEKLTSACSVEFTVVDYSTPTSLYTPVIVYAYTNGETTPNQMIMMNYPSRIDVLGTSINHELVKGAVYKIEYTSSTISVYENGTLLATANNNIGFPTRFEYHMGANGRYAVYKNLKVKPL